MDWDLDKGEILKTYKNEFECLKTIFFMKKVKIIAYAYAIIFAKFQVLSSHFDKLPYFTQDFPTNQIMDWDLDKGEIGNLSENLQKWVWLAKNDFFHERRHTR